MDDISKRIQHIIEKHAHGNASILSRELSVNKATLSNYLKGRMPSSDFLITLEEKLNININWLLTGKGEMHTYSQIKDNSQQYLEASHAKIDPKLLQDSEGETVILSRELIDLIPGIDAALKGCTELAKIKDTPPELIIDTLYRILDNAKKVLTNNPHLK